MTSKIEEAEIITMYLCQVKKKLPLGIRLNKTELNDILDEIEAQIWEIAIESAGDKEPNEINVQIAITQIGEPQSIASKFTSRSTPHVYISEEVYPAYKKYRKTLFWSSVLFFLLYTLFFSFYIVPWHFSIIFVVNIIYVGIYFTSSVILGIVFCYFSMTGYLPYELRKSKMQKKYSNIAQIQKPKFKSPFQRWVIRLEIFFFLISAMIIFFWSRIFVYFTALSIIKILRGFIKTKSVKWQRSLIFLDLFLMCSTIFAIENEIFYLRYVIITPQHIVHISVQRDLREIITILSPLWAIVILYAYYEVHVFINLKEKQELYLKEISLIKRIKKKKSMLGKLKNRDSPNQQNIKPNNQTLRKKSSEIYFEYEEVIKPYLRKAKRRLPFWLKKAEKQNLIKNLEDKIREAVSDFEEKNVLTNEKLRKFLANLENTETIVSEFKQRGSPKIFISKELWSWYLTILKSVLVYFSIISVFTIVLEMSLNILSTFANIFFYFIGLWILCVFILILSTYFFMYLSTNDVIPEKIKILSVKQNLKTRINLHNIWEGIFAEVYMVMGLISIFSVFLERNSLNFPGINLIIIVSGFLLLLGMIKILKIVIKRKNVILKSFLIFLSLVFSLLINFILIYISLFQQRIFVVNIFYALYLLNLLFLPINLEIIYETFHFFIRIKNERDL
ncbi:MAG: hypothetical protein ACXABO_18740 [Promethearchaeota archaeon]|jgi:hypothetical protein